MAWPRLLLWMLQNAAQGGLRRMAADTAQRIARSPPDVPAESPKDAHLGLIFALSIESGCLEDLLDGMVVIRGKGVIAREGGLRGRRTIVVRSGPGLARARHATELLIDGHRPSRIISAGFAGAISGDLHRNDLLVADRVRNESGEEIAVELPPGLAATLQQPGVHCGPLLTCRGVVRKPSARRALFERHGAMAVDMETFAVAEVCRRRGVPFSSIRAINDTADETLSRDVEHLLAQRTAAAQWGAALGAVLRRPASAKDFYQLRENALVASLRLAKFLAAVRFD
ncbi:MAG: hypothetical protein LLF97_00185 [Planctomycetaceae bacterium]|nr:hypothetical protein [Planctomycetaceae bacterium]